MAGAVARPGRRAGECSLSRPLCVDLFCGLGGWSDGFLAEGYDVIGFDIERHDYGRGAYPGQLVIQDVLTLHGSQFRNAACIVASPPCQKYSYMAMPWKRAKEQAAWYREPMLPGEPTRIGELNALFNACFRVQHQACIAAGREIPMVVENVKGAQPWVGRAKWHYGSFYLWGDVPALMPFTSGRSSKLPPGNCSDAMWVNRPIQRLNDANKNAQIGSGSWFAIGSPGQKVTGVDPGVAGHFSSKSSARKAASAEIAKIPFELAAHIARCFHPSAIGQPAANIPASFARWPR